MDERFVPEDFEAPDVFEGPGFRLEPLGPGHNERDHDAWMSSIEHIHATPGFDSDDDRWPEPMTPEANLEDLNRHAKDFRDRTGFTYSVLDGEEVIGCVYIYPAPDGKHDADISSWVRKTRGEMDEVVWRAVSGWILNDWPFANPRYAPRAET